MQACNPRDGRIRNSRLGGEMAQKVKALAQKPGDIRSPHGERRDQPLHAVLTPHATVVCTNPHTKLIRGTQKGDQTSEGYTASTVNGQNRLHSAISYDTPAHTYPSPQTIKK